MGGEGLVVGVELVVVDVPDAADAAAAAAVAGERLLGRLRRRRRRGIGLLGLCVAEGEGGHGREWEAAAATGEKGTRRRWERRDRSGDAEDGTQHSASAKGKEREVVSHFDWNLEARVQVPQGSQLTHGTSPLVRLRLSGSCFHVSDTVSQ